MRPDDANPVAATKLYEISRRAVTAAIMGNTRSTGTGNLQYDGLGRLTAVWEVEGGGSSYLTTYTYGANNLLQKVTQGAQTRTFTYDSLGRMTASVQRESGTVSYTYDNVGNVTSRSGCARDRKRLLLRRAESSDINRLLRRQHLHAAVHLR